jgi:hypothetical protein
MSWRTIVEGQTGDGALTVPVSNGRAPKCILITGTFSAGVIIFRAVPWKGFTPVATNPGLLVCKRSVPGTWSASGTSILGYHILDRKILGSRPQLHEMELVMIGLTGDLDIYASY